ncbi:MAG TPA: RHS repeat-associated core domain-containing protein [bacterium]|nr:RHS repeat-associated core domain-containing protein [bacterium]
MAKVDAAGGILEQYVYATGINSPDYIVKGDRKYRLVKDHLGSVRLVVDTHDGAVVKRLDYDVSGQVINEEGDFDLIFGFAGGFRDTDTGLTKFGARWYDPETARWTSKEPLGFNGGSNFYVYAGNDPVNFVDVNGLWNDRAHQDLTASAMKDFGFDPYEILLAQTFNLKVDDDQKNNAAHYMPDNAKEAEELIEKHFQNAILCQKAGNRRSALIELGRAMHTLQDKYAHGGLINNAFAWFAHAVGFLTLTEYPDTRYFNPGWTPFSNYNDAENASRNLVQKFINETR